LHDHLITYLNNWSFRNSDPHSVLATENSAHWTLSNSCIEAETSSLVLRRTSSSNKTQSANSRMLGRLYGERTLTMISTYQLT
jgi:hypothetical protein